MTREKRLKIEKRIEAIKMELAELGAMRPGSLTKQYKNRQQKHGEYYQLSYTHEMKSHTDYVRKDYVGTVQQQVDNYQHFKALTAEWVALSIEHGRLSMKRDKSE